LTDDDGGRGATANQAGHGDRRRTNPEKFHTKLTSCRTAKLRFSVVAGAVGPRVSSLISFAAILILGAFAVVLGLFKLRESLFVIRQT
jgi:hypothetical protein